MIVEHQGGDAIVAGFGAPPLDRVPGDLGGDGIARHAAGLAVPVVQHVEAVAARPRVQGADVVVQRGVRGIERAQVRAQRVPERAQAGGARRARAAGERAAHPGAERGADRPARPVEIAWFLSRHGARLSAS